MATNLSRNKVRVSNVLGTTSTIGLMDPAINMQVRHGCREFWIVATGDPGSDTPRAQCQLSLTSGGTPLQLKAYPHDLFILASGGLDNPKIGIAGTATYFGWPTTQGSVVFGDNGIFPPPSGAPKSGPVGGEYRGGDGTAHTITYGPYTD